ncbi:hypothetical protein BH11PSE1_BH11PSE1_03950 [soil metagenome]
MVETKRYYSEKGLTASLYDITTALDPTLVGDIEVYAAMVPAGGHVLELGAGTGRVSLDFAARGFRVTGLDLAPAMLAQAEAKRAVLPPELAARLTFVQGDMAALSLPGVYDAVICPYYGLSHLPAGAAWKNVFSGVARHLKPGALAAFHLPDAKRMAEAPKAPKGMPVLQHTLPDGHKLLVYIHERTARLDIGRFDQVVDHVVTDTFGKEQRRARERITFYDADPTPYAQAAGLVKDREPIPQGGVGAIHVFRKLG